MSNTPTLLPVKVEVVQAVEVEVLSPEQHRQECEQKIAQAVLKQDQFARDRAFRLLKRCQSGSVPNLLQGAGLMHFDAILASKVVVRLLQLNFLAQGRRYQQGQPSGYLIPANAELVSSCGNMLFDLGGIGLMEQVIEQWVPALAQKDLRQAWQAIGQEAAPASDC